MALTMLGLAGMVVAAWWGGLSSSSHGQPGLPPPPRPRALVQAGLDLYKRGDYENAALYLTEADKGKEELSPRERDDLKNLIQLNSGALKKRQEGAAYLRRADEALRQGKPVEAGNLLKMADNQFLAPADRTFLVSMQEKLRAVQPAGRGPDLQMPPGIKGDYKSLLSAARVALQRGDFDLADNLAQQADKVKPTMSWPLSDTPAKVHRDVQIARTKLAPQPPPAPAPLPPLIEKGGTAKKDGFFKNMLPFGKYTPKETKPAEPV